LESICIPAKKYLMAWHPLQVNACNESKAARFLPQRLVADEEKKTETKLRGLSPQSNYTDRATAACRRT
jgi:hypothetical protein